MISVLPNMLHINFQHHICVYSMSNRILKVNPNPKTVEQIFANYLKIITYMSKIKHTCPHHMMAPCTVSKLEAVMCNCSDEPQDVSDLFHV